jgi:CubicO group peptidase (beta-lactamase class C family)
LPLFNLNVGVEMMGNNWWKRSATAILAIALLIPSAAVLAKEESAGTQSYSATRQAAAEKAALLTEDYGVASVQYALFDNGRIAVSGQAGINDEQGLIPLNNDTVYGVGSVAKVYAAAAVMRLVDEGKLKLDEPVVSYLPAFTMKDSRYKQITPRMLLNHSSGLNGSTMTNSILYRDNDTYAHDHFLEDLSQQELKADPGAYSVYSNDSFTLAELLVEEVSGMSFTEFIQHTFFEPLALSRTYTASEELNEQAVAALYSPMREGQMPLGVDNAIGSGGIYSTAEELALFGGLFAGYGQGLLSDTAVTQMAQEEYKRGLWPEQGSDMFNYGLGWDSVHLAPFGDYGIKALTKGGDTLFYHAQLIVLPEQGMTAAVLSSGGSSIYNSVFASDLLLQALKERGDINHLPSPKSFGKPDAAVPPQEQLDYAGVYGNFQMVYQVGITPEGKLLLSDVLQPEAGAVEYLFTENGDYVRKDGTAKVRFVEGTNGRVYLWNSQYLSLPGLGQTVLTHYEAEKLDKNEISRETAEKWAERDGKIYYILNEKFTSALYVANMATTVQLMEDVPGYNASQKITGPNSSKSDIQIPGMNGRDHMPYQFYQENGTEYLQVQSYLFISEDGIKTVYGGQKSKVTIQKDGHARWFTIPEAAVGKRLTVSRPAQSSFAVYDEAGECVYFSQVDDDRAVELPANGKVVFVGEPGTIFQLSLK